MPAGDGLSLHGVALVARNSAPSWLAECETDPVRTILNLIWLVLSGFWLALAYYVLWPFGRTVIRRPGAGAASMVGNVLWFLLGGVWIAIAHVFLGLLLCLTIVGIPLGLGNFKLAAVAIAPLGKEIVSTNDPRAALGAVSF